MKNFSLKFFIYCLLIAAPLALSAQDIEYTPLEPLPGLGEAQRGTGDFAAVVIGFFKILVNVGAFVAVTMLVIGGITYMVSEKTFSKLLAREQIKAAFFGMAILAGAWLTLNTINPQLLTFDRELLDAVGSYSPGNRPPVTPNEGRRDLSSEEFATVVRAVGCKTTATGSYSNCLWNEIYVYDGRSLQSSKVVAELEAYEAGCKGYFNIQGWQTLSQSGSLLDLPGKTVRVCVTRQYAQ